MRLQPTMHPSRHLMRPSRPSTMPRHLTEPYLLPSIRIRLTGNSGRTGQLLCRVWAAGMRPLKPTRKLWRRQTKLFCITPGTSTPMTPKPRCSSSFPDTTSPSRSMISSLESILVRRHPQRHWSGRASFFSKWEGPMSPCKASIEQLRRILNLLKPGAGRPASWLS